ncbi:hypothetical protein IWW41_000873 [Coemansia sp. RSA 2522]|nr:hypothetical protein IW144_000727 [Coemansia sp. RSA 522]KAJ2435445.1 hypothetical protein IWW41_000873 [Coemansia sp. RSA 2522]
MLAATFLLLAINVFTNKSCANKDPATMLATVAELRLELDEAKRLHIEELKRQHAEQKNKINIMLEVYLALQRSHEREGRRAEKYNRAFESKELEIENLYKDLLAVERDCNIKTEIIASLKYNEEQYQEEIEELQTKLGLSTDSLSVF